MAQRNLGRSFPRPLVLREIGIPSRSERETAAESHSTGRFWQKGPELKKCPLPCELHDSRPRE